MPAFHLDHLAWVAMWIIFAHCGATARLALSRQDDFRIAHHSTRIAASAAQEHLVDDRLVSSVVKIDDEFGRFPTLSGSQSLPKLPS